MKYSEFNKKLYEFELQYSDYVIYIYCDGVMVGKVSKDCRYYLSTAYEGFNELPEPVALMLYENMMMLAETPIADREEEKRYRLRLDVPLFKNAQPKYYVFNPELGIELFRNLTCLGEWQAIFTESEISQMDITGFKKEEVE